jgi:hypothetical protein
MVLQGIAGFNSLEHKPRQTAAVNRDTGKPIVSSSQNQNRSEFLKLVQDKIKKGFYSSDIVLEDLSHSFAGAFDKRV